MQGKRTLALLTFTLAGLAPLLFQPADAGSTALSANGEPQSKILVSIADDTWTDDTLYTLEPDGSGQTRLFDFHSHPKHTIGRIWQPRVASDGGSVYFSSDNAYAYTPASRNLFRIAADGSWWDQITPGPNSGRWDQPCPCGTVEGTVKKSNGDPWGNSPVYLEGMSMLYSQPDGSFRFDNVPVGARWIVAYKPGDTPFDSEAITVVAGSTVQVDLVPVSDYRTSFQSPALWGSRVYHLLDTTSIAWTDLAFSTHPTVYTTPADSCIGVPDVDAFDVARTSGRLVIVDYQEGCGAGNTNHLGLYTADKDGNNLQLLVDMMADPNWQDSLHEEVFWSPDETKIAFKTRYNGYDCLMVFGADGSFKGSICANQSSDTLSLHGWSPDGNWLLYSIFPGDPAQTTLSKIRVNDDGSFDPISIVNLLVNVRLSGATWGNLSAEYKVFLPVVSR